MLLNRFPTWEAKVIAIDHENGLDLKPDTKGELTESKDWRGIQSPLQMQSTTILNTEKPSRLHEEAVFWKSARAVTISPPAEL